MTKVSVIIPIYNAEKYLKRCLESIIKQTLTDIEIICINDGSTDNSAQILEEYSKKDNRIKIITQINSGVSEARNKGLKYATGEFIGFVDSDDFIEENFYEKLYDSAIENDCDIACSGIIRKNNKKQTKLISYEMSKTAVTVPEKFKLCDIPKSCYACNKIYRTDLLKDNCIKFIVGKVYEDMYFTPNIVIKANKIISVPDVYYYYWKHAKSIIKTVTDKTRADKIDAYNYLSNITKEYIRESSYSLKRKKDYVFLGIKILKIYEYKATKKYYLFGLIPVLTVKEYI